MLHTDKIGLGTAAIGRPQYINIRQKSNTSFEIQQFREQGLELLEMAYDEGLRYFDTAPGYGLAEDLMREWVKKKQDSAIEIATKWGYTYVADFLPDAKIHEVKDHSLEQLNKQWNESKRMLPYVTTLQIHSATFETGVLKNERVLQRLLEIKTKNNLRIGLTTTGDNQTEVLRAALDVHVSGEQLFDVFQTTYNVFDQSLFLISSELKGKRLVVKEALANGRIFKNKNFPHYIPIYNYLEELACKYEVGVDAISLRFCLDSVDPFVVLSGASDQLQLKQNLEALKFRLAEKEVMKLRSMACEPYSYWKERKQLPWN